MNPENKAELERILTGSLFRKEPGPHTRVVLSDDGQYAFLYVADKCTRRKLSRYGKEFLRTGSAVLTQYEFFVEPEEG
jgi:hypothetical protein